MTYPRRKITGRGFKYELYYTQNYKNGNSRGKFFKYNLLFLECGHCKTIHEGYVPKKSTGCRNCYYIAKFFDIISGGSYTKRYKPRQPLFIESLSWYNPYDWVGTTGKKTEFYEYVTDFKIMWE